MGEWARDGKFIYTGRRNEGGANFRAGECALFTESSAGYAGIKAEAEFDFDVRPLPYWEGVGNSPQNTIIGGASLWVMEGHEAAEYEGAARVPGAFCRRRTFRRNGTRTPAICRSRLQPARRHAPPVSMTQTPAPMSP